MQRNEATQRQITAALPDRSTWLSANAGSGKTRVLTDRVARLLLDHVDPQNILCLTYTKAAASEMQNRLFKRLGAWAMLPDKALSQQLHELGIETRLDADALRHARKLFACAIETPGGLKIQTIHSFCSSLLRRFPLEAGVTPQFAEMEDRTAALLRSEIIEEMADGPHADTLYTMARHYTGESFADLSAEIVKHRGHFAQPLTDTALESQFGTPPNRTLRDVAASVFLSGEEGLIQAMIAALKNSSANDQKAAEKLARIATLDAGALPALEDVFLTGASAKSPFSAKIGSFPTTAGRESLAAHMPAIEAWMLRVEDARAQRLAVMAIAKTRALHGFAQVFLPAYDAAKLARGWLDFDDLILRARDLLTDRKVADWVLFKLDGGIDHILVDEAQDTSPVQWQVIERIAQEFTSGEGARTDILRTIFVVGDKKQSIYSFQGADPREFDRMQREFARRLETSGAPLQNMELEYSFRSSSAVLSLVDATFTRHEKSGFAPEQRHKAFKADMPGRVDLWPVIPKPEKDDRPDWHDPVDVKAPNDPAVLLAKEVARSIKQLIESKHPIPLAPEDGGPYLWRAVQPGDFLILVQRRSDLFHEIIRECKAGDLPVAGADRLKVGAELAVRDLAALLSFLATPEDSLSLATALKSPLFGWTEAELYDLAHGRSEKYLWAEMRKREADYPETIHVLRDLLKQADFLRPYDLIERILTRHRGRYNLLSRLGAEAEDGIDALLSQAMAYEQQAVDSLTGFLIWMDTDDLEIKRQMDSAGNRIRVMTVHGAKGLEAPIVVLPDCGKRDIRLRDNVIVRDDTPLWRPSSAEAPAAITEANTAAKEAQHAERDRLLYVAMTRAEKWLIVAAAGDLGSSGDTWYDKVRAGMTNVGATPCAFEYGDGLQHLQGDWPAAATEDTRDDTHALIELPPFYQQPAPPAPPEPETLSPSDLGGAKALPGEEGLDEDAAKLRGTQIHQLLEILPDHLPPDWPTLAEQVLGEGADPTLLTEAHQVLTSPELTSLFERPALTEVPVSANLIALDGRRIHGVIDRLIVGDGRILAIDYKTNAHVPDSAANCPDGILRQMGAYAHALQLLYPAYEIEVAVLWTRAASLMSLPHDLVTEALFNTQIS